jgi:hypothetical protein
MSPIKPISNQFSWYVEEHGGGVMVIEPKCFGRAFLTETHTAEDLVFVPRAEDRKLT